ncbi:MAG TPA: PRC and DUF2382 domain-containing protein [Segetibacter sp.]|nr:PRC and DUF2382 domain-containing protein [Segetibacter sp.]
MSNENKNKRLQELGGSDFEIADGQHDIRGWDVKDANGKKIGEVDELIFDIQTRKVRYIVLDMDDNDFDLDDREVLVPIGIAQLHDKGDDVILPGVTAEHLRLLPEYEEGNISADVENKIRNAFAGVGGAALTGAALTSGTANAGDDDFYNHNHFNEDNLYRNRKSGGNDEQATIPVIEEKLQVGKQEVAKGGIRLRSRIVENEVQENIKLREEKIRVERTPVDRAANVTDLKEEQVEFTERAEVPVVSKEARVVEEVSLNKEVTEKEESIKDTVRSTKVDIEKTDNSDDLNTRSGTNRI